MTPTPIRALLALCGLSVVGIVTLAATHTDVPSILGYIAVGAFSAATGATLPAATGLATAMAATKAAGIVVPSTLPPLGGIGAADAVPAATEVGGDVITTPVVPSNPTGTNPSSRGIFDRPSA